MKLQAPEFISNHTSGFCPGCGHGLAIRTISEVTQELGIDDKTVAVCDVACGSLAIDYWGWDTIMAAHGRPIPTAVGVKKVRPDQPVFAYVGDGAAYSIGLAETMHAALRNDNIIVFVIMNTVFGMTGGQMAPTTLPGQKTTSSPHGKSADIGVFNVVNALSGMNIAYLARGEMVGPAGMLKCKAMVKKAFEKHMNNEGFCLVELVSPCPTNLNKTPVKTMEYLHDEVSKYFPTGEFICK